MAQLFSLGHMKHHSILGLILNIFFTIVLAVLIAKYYLSYEVPQIPADRRLIWDEKIIHLYNYGLFPVVAAGMILSAFWFWKLRK